MSLTTFVERDEVREQLGRVLPDYQRTLRLPLLVPSRGANPGLVGTAFDYAFRFEVQRRNPAAKHAAWVAEAALVQLAHMARRLGDKDRVGRSVPAGRPRRLAVAVVQMIVEARAVIAEAKSFLRRYIATKAPTAKQRRTLGHCAVRLARLDVIHRAGLLDGALDAPTVDEVAEVAELVAAIPRGLGARGRVFLNPTFGAFSLLVGGADADVIAGSTLIDVKTTKHALVEKAMVRQVVGYMLLARAARASKQRLPKIDTLAIYFSRHAHLWELPVARVVDRQAFAAVEQWFLAGAKAVRDLKPLPSPPAEPSGVVLADDDYEDGWEEGLENQSLYEWPYGADL